jgi:hypothetical protein
MAIVVTGVMVIKTPSDSNQASYEEGVCLASIAGHTYGLAIFNFVEEGVFVDTQTNGA